MAEQGIVTGGEQRRVLEPEVRESEVTDGEHPLVEAVELGATNLRGDLRPGEAAIQELGRRDDAVLAGGEPGNGGG